VAGGVVTAATPPGTGVPAGEHSWGWHLFRVSGLVLAVLVPLEVVTGLLVTDVADWSADAVADRWANPWWRAVDWAFLVLALVHGGMGVARLLQSGIADPARRRLAVAVVSAALIVLGLASTTVVFTFEI
jgi:succinate dehydrogenase / fumarate reductase, membrane anchor subunit